MTTDRAGIELVESKLHGVSTTIGEVARNSSIVGHLNVGDVVVEVCYRQRLCETSGSRDVWVAEPPVLRN